VINKDLQAYASLAASAAFGNHSSLTTPGLFNFCLAARIKSLTINKSLVMLLRDIIPVNDTVTAEPGAIIRIDIPRIIINVDGTRATEQTVSPISTNILLTRTLDPTS